MTIRTIAASLLILVAAQAAKADAAPASPDETHFAGADLEQQTREQDLAAVQAYMTSINKLAYLSKQKEGSQEEATFLFRIAEALYKVAALQFRLAHSATPTKGDGPNMSAYLGALDQLGKLCSKIATKFPRHQDIPRAIYLRAQSYKELGKDAEAIRDFRYLIDNFPKSDDIATAQMSLYEVFLKTKDFHTAITYLKKLEASSRNEQYYPLVLDRLAFSNYSVNEIPEALRYLELELSVIPESEAANGGYSEREKTLKNAALYYYTGLESKKPGYTIQGAMPYFLKLKPGALLGKVVTHFSNLLRSKGRDEDLEAFKKNVLASNCGPDATAEILLASAEISVNKKRYDRLKESVDLLSATLDKLGNDPKKIEKTQKLLSDAAGKVQSVFTKVKDTPESAQVVPALLSLYNLMLKTASTDGARQKIEFNMAETYFAIKKYEAAALHYRWIADTNAAPEKGSEDLLDQARFKSMTARYEAMSEKKLFPKDLAPRALEGSPKTEVPKEAAQWITWIDGYEKVKHKEPADAFEYEAARVLYGSGQVADAVARLNFLIKTYPASKYVLPAQSLIVDTYVTSEKWEETNQIATSFLKSNEGSDPAKSQFHAKLIEIAGDSYFKTIELLYKDKAYDQALTKVEAFLKQYPSSKKKENCLVLAANAALALKDKKRALAYFAPMMKENGAKPEIQGTALLTSASVAEEKQDYAAAAAEYRKYFKLPAKSWGLDASDLKNLRAKDLLWAWLSGRSSLLKETINTPTVCTSELFEQCARYTALLSLMDPARRSDKNLTKKALEQTQKTKGAPRSIWATIALENPKAIGFNERLQLLEVVSSEWDKQDSLTKYTMLPALSTSIPAGMRQAAAEIRAMSKLKLDKAAITKRTALIQKMENTISKVLDLPWTRIRAEATNELGNLYRDLAADLHALPTPKGLAGDDLAQYNQMIGEIKAPFKKKAEDLHRQAFELATDTAIESESYDVIAAAHAADNPENKGAPKPALPGLHGPLAGVDLFERLQFPAAVTTAAAAAVKDSNWPLLAFLIQDAKEKKTLNDGQLAAARGVSLILAGAQAESMTELKDAVSSLDKPAKYQLMPVLVMAHYGVRSKDHTKTAIEKFVGDTNRDIRKTAIKPSYARFIAEASSWSGAEISNGDREEIAALAGQGGRAPAQQRGK